MSDPIYTLAQDLYIIMAENRLNIPLCRAISSKVQFTDFNFGKISYYFVS